MRTYFASRSRLPDSLFCIRAALPALIASALLLGAPEIRAESSGGTQPGELPNDGFVDADFCGQCHGGGYMGNYSFMPSDTWTGTMMGNAARDPVFFAALTVANQDVPGSGSFCMHCHTPIGFVRGHTTPSDGSMLDKIDVQGVGCDTCHRAQKTEGPAGPYLLGNAQLIYTEDTTKTGPYQGAVSIAHTTVAEPALGQSRFCGQCHRVTNPMRLLRDETGKETADDFPLDITYDEWEQSSFGTVGSPDFQSCQDCHMRPKLGSWPVSDQPDSPFRKNPRRHDFVGGNYWGIRAIMHAHPQRAETYATEYTSAIDRTEWMLRTSVKVSIADAPAQVRPGETIRLHIRVENLTGHKFPTGYAEGRRAWVAIALADGDLSDGDLKERTLIGVYNEQTGEISEDPPTHIYRSLHGRWNGTAGEPEASLVLQDMILSDTRIPPKGFISTPRTKPSEEINYRDEQGAYRNYDELELDLHIPDDWIGQSSLLARVYYQSMTREHIEYLAQENHTDNRGQDLLTIYEETGAAAPMNIAEAEWKMMVKAQEPPKNSAESVDSGCFFHGLTGQHHENGGIGWASLGGIWALIALRYRRKR